MDSTARQLERDPQDLRALAAARLRQGDMAGASAALRAELERLKVVAEEAHRASETAARNAAICRVVISRATCPDYWEAIDRRTKACDDAILLCSEIAALERSA